MEAKIIIEDWQGRHNSAERAKELDTAGLYKDASTICIVPTRGVIPARCVQNWMGMILPMNQKFTRIFMIGMEVAAAYNAAIENILAHPELSTWKYVLTLEEDNVVPPDGLLKLLEALHSRPDLSVIGGLYWTKGEGGQPMIYGDPQVFPKNFIPQLPRHEAIQEANGLGMGFNLFRLEMFKSIPKPWFKSLQQYTPGAGVTAMSQDLYFYQEAAKLGYKFACDTKIKVGHYDLNNDIIW